MRITVYHQHMTTVCLPKSTITLRQKYFIDAAPQRRYVTEQFEVDMIV